MTGIEHLFGVLQALLWQCDDDSPTYRRTRVVKKFFDEAGERLNQLITAFGAESDRLQKVDSAIAAERNEYEEVDDELEDEWALRRLEGGLSNLYAMTLILAQLFVSSSVEDGPAIILGHLDDHGIEVKTLTTRLEEYTANLDAKVFAHEVEHLTTIQKIMALHA